MKGSRVLAAAILLGGVGLTDPAAAISEDEAARNVAEAYDVQVLRVVEDEIDGQAVWLVTVMKGGGDRNDAFQVSTLALDRQSGELVPSFRHRASGYDLPPKPASGDTESVRPDAMRGGVWR